jgi:virginiamycin A acetyltransferase
MEVGKYTYGNEKIQKIFQNEFPDVKVVLGKFCSIANNIRIYCGNGYHNSNHISTYPFGHVHTEAFGNKNPNKGTTKGSVVIGNDVWIGDNVVIMSGVKIGDGAIIANNSHVIQDVQPYSIVGGNPAKLIKFRFEKYIISELMRISWWNWSEEKIKENQNILNSDNIEEFIKKNK